MPHLPLKLRRATLSDLSVIGRQRVGMFRGMGYANSPQLRRHEGQFRRWARRLMVSGELVGFLVETRSPQPKVVAGGLVWIRSWQPHPGLSRPRVPYLLNMYTDPSFRGRGLATLITDSAMKWAKTKKFPYMLLHASPMGRRVYRRLGWNRTWEMRVSL